MENQLCAKNNCNKVKNGKSKYCEDHKYKPKKCIHDKRKERCKVCGGSSICIHNKRKDSCKECGKKNFCEHNKAKNYCKTCKGKSICVHNKQKSLCVDCKGSGICSHDKRKYRCIHCKGSSICDHFKEKYLCIECNGNGLCIHNKIKIRCKDCDGSCYCTHNKRKDICKYCNFTGYLVSNVRSRIYSILKENKKISSIEYLGCDSMTFKKNIENKFKNGMTWENYGSEWHIDHIIPIMYNKDEISLEKIIERLHYTNTQPLWKTDNLIKGNRYIG